MARAAAAPSPARPVPTRSPRRPPNPQRAEALRRPRAAPLPRGALVLDVLLHGSAWIALVFVLLVGIVFFNVDLLRMNREIAATAEQTATVKQQNARLRTDLARLGSSERIQRVAAERGLVLPAPGEVRYLRSHPTVDARRAAQRIAAGEAVGPQTGAPVGTQAGASPGPQAGAPALQSQE